MKKYGFIIIGIAIMLLCAETFAEVVTTQRRVQPQNPETQKTTGNKLADNVKMCKPYSETLKSDVSGVNFIFTINIAGWVNDKCRINFTAKSNGLSEAFQSLYAVDDADVSVVTFEPKVKCEFTKRQLEYVGDSILQENERNNGAINNMLKNPNEIVLTNLSPSDQRLLNVILNEGACKILNADNSNMLDSILGF